MPQFTVRRPDGSTLKVNAPAGATRAQVIAFAKKQPVVKAPQKSSGWWETIKNANDQVSSGLIGPGWTQKLRAVDDVIGNAFNAATGDENFEPVAAYSRGLTRVRKEADAFSQRNPIGSKALTGLGIVGSFGVPSLNVAKGTNAAGHLTTASHIKNSAATAGLQGAVIGSGAGESWQERVNNTIAGGIGGGLVGATAVPLVTLGVSGLRRGWNLASPLIDKGASAVRDLTARAERQVAEALSHNGGTPQAAAHQVRTMQAQGVPAMLADTSDGARQVTAWSSRGHGPGQSAVKAAIRKRQEGLAPRMRAHVDESLGSTVNPQAQSAALRETARTNAKPLYDAANQKQIVVTPALREFMDSPVGPAAIESGINSVNMIPKAERSFGSETPLIKDGFIFDPKLGKGGDYRSGEVPAMEVWDGAKRHLDDLEFQTNSQFQTNPQGMSSDTRGIDLRRKQLVTELDAQNPEYAQAREAFAGPTQERKAFEAGIDRAGRATANDATAQMSTMTPSQRAQFQLGDRTALADSISGSKTAPGLYADATTPVRGNEGRRALIEAVHGPEAAEKLFGRARAERQGHLTYKAVDGGSDTAMKIAADEDIGGDNLAIAVNHASRGRIIPAVTAFFSQAWNKSLTAGQQSIKAEVGRMMTETNITNIDEAMALVAKRMETDAAFADRISSAGAATGRAATTGIIGQSGDYSDPNDWPQ